MGIILGWADHLRLSPEVLEEAGLVIDAAKLVHVETWGNGNHATDWTKAGVDLHGVKGKVLF